MSSPAPLICEVCHRPLDQSDQYLVRFDAARGTTIVHRSLCFPPPRVEAPAQPQRLATPA